MPVVVLNKSPYPSPSSHGMPVGFPLGALMVMVGGLRYPLPAFAMLMAVTTPPEMVTDPVALVPPAGGELNSTVAEV